MRRREPDSIADAAREDAARREDEARNDAELWARWQEWCGDLADARAMLAKNYAEIERINLHMAEVAEWICAEMPDPDRLMDLPPRRSKFHPVGTAEGRDG